MKHHFEKIHIYGDNIIECERAMSLIQDSFGHNVISARLLNSSIVCPCFLFQFKNSKASLQVTLYPGFGRWDHDILQSIKERGGVLRETADAIVVGIINDEASILFALEFCGALPAGNQAWQRSGRAYSFGYAGIPYLYISELGGYELDNFRKRKSPRLPNPAVPFSYLAFSKEQNATILPIFIVAPGADEESKSLYKDIYANEELLEFIQNCLLNNENTLVVNTLQSKVLDFIFKRSDGSNRNTLSKANWLAAYNSLRHRKGLANFLLKSTKQKWSKTITIASCTSRARKIQKLTNGLGTGLTSSRLPICLLDKVGRHEFANGISELYSDLSPSFLRFIFKKQSLAICWVAGFKPKGEDSRPDRGLLPMTRMLIGSQLDILTIIYGPAPKKTWEDLVTAPSKLAEKNGLWESIMATSNAILIESSTDSVTKHGYVLKHRRDQIRGNARNIILPLKPIPKKFGEHDVDTALHILFSEILASVTFECMCNPPGGDWSGISLIENNYEYRWLSLPRVSGANSKRPRSCGPNIWG